MRRAEGEWRRGEPSGTTHPGEQGSATIWTVAGIAVVFLFTAVIVAVGAATVTRHRADTAADLAALAAAAWAFDGEQVACRRAGWVVQRMGMTLRSCALAGWDAAVEVSATVDGLPVLDGTTTAHARAGPVNR